MMMRTYNADSRKDRFITERLLPYLIDSLEDGMQDQPGRADEIAKMCIFPFKTADGPKLGSLNVKDISWYFAADGDEQCLSTGSYRIFDDTLLKKEQVRRFQKICRAQEWITDFSDEAVIRELVIRMGRETDYSELWWTCAYDIFKLWRPEAYELNMKRATASITGNGFLFMDEYKGSSLKESLIAYGVFSDVFASPAGKAFWDMIPEDGKENAINMLEEMGVPCSFIVQMAAKRFGNETFSEQVHPCILEFTKRIHESVRFPVTEIRADYQKCELIHELFLKIIYEESGEAFRKAVGETEYSGGIPILNAQGDFVPLLWNLFYYKPENDNESIIVDGDVPIISDSKFEYLHIDASRYNQEIIGKCKQIHEFSEVKEPAETYGIEWDEAFDFYQWVWQYSQHKELASNILFHAENCYYEKVPQQYNELVLSAFAVVPEDEGYYVNLNLDVEMAFCWAKTLNRLDREFNGVDVEVFSEYEKINVSQYLKRVLDAASATYLEKSKIENDPIWEHVYLVDGEIGMHNDVFVKCTLYMYVNWRENLYNGGFDEFALALWPAHNEDSYLHAIAAYIQDVYSVETNMADAESFDWKSEYNSLIDGIRGFVCAKTKRQSPEDMYVYDAEMDDIKDFGTEKRIWTGLIDARNTIMNHSIGSNPELHDQFRAFLSSKYNGRCQLCGRQTITGVQNAHFYTYRIVKEHKNRLANLFPNLFCLCPSCHGEMGYGDFMGKDMSELYEKAIRYAAYMRQTLRDESMESDFPSLVSELWEEQQLTEEEQEQLEGFHNPIVCRVVVNGKDRCMAFSWEHFMQLAFVLSDAADADNQR